MQFQPHPNFFFFFFFFFFRFYWRLANQLVGALPHPTGLECEREILQLIKGNKIKIK
jgi:hypothetical protein